MSDPTVADVLIRAIEVLERDGWCQKTLKDDEGRYCALGAVNTAARELKADDAVYESVRGRLDAYALTMHPRGSAPLHLAPIARLNDDDNTTAEDVILSFKHVIAEQGGAA